MNYLLPATSLLLLSVLVVSEDLQYRNIVLTRIANVVNRKYFDKVSMPRKAINRTTSLTSIDITILPNVSLDSPLYVEFVANKKFSSGTYKPYLINVKYELCDMLKFRNHPIFKIVSEIVNRNENNMLEPCPLKGNKFVKPYYTSYDNLPMVPTGSWRFDIIIIIESNKTAVEILRNQNFYEITANFPTFQANT